MPAVRLITFDQAENPHGLSIDERQGENYARTSQEYREAQRSRLPVPITARVIELPASPA
jgi:hypothetical protein